MIDYVSDQPDLHDGRYGGLHERGGMHEIVDSYGEGGIQLLWSAVALAAYSRSVHLLNVRPKSSNPGLAPQHPVADQVLIYLAVAGEIIG
jgi:hypothetical protein